MHNPLSLMKALDFSRYGSSTRLLGGERILKGKETHSGNCRMRRGTPRPDELKTTIETRKREFCNSQLPPIMESGRKFHHTDAVEENTFQCGQEHTMMSLNKRIRFRRGTPTPQQNMQTSKLMSKLSQIVE